MPQFCAMFWKRILFGLLATSLLSMAQAQPLQSGKWLFTLSRPGGLPVYVQANLQQQGSHYVLAFLNDTETLEINNLRLSGDSLHFDMPLFETRLGFRIQSVTQLEGWLLKGTSGEYQRWQVTGQQTDGPRIPGKVQPPVANLSGRWAMQFQRADGSWRPAIAELKQQGNRLTGTIINPSGDYRFLEGRVSGKELYLTAFDGAHIYAFKAQASQDSIVNGVFFSGNAPGDAFKAMRDAKASLPDVTAAAAGMKSGESRLQFRFPDLDSNMVSLTDDRFKGKVTIVQIMGSWCPNCMDETKFLSDYYNGQKMPQVEIVSLAYELSTDFTRSAASLRKFKQRFNVRYPMLITGVKSADPDKAAKTLPQLTDIKYFPTTIFIDKQGRVRKVHNGFYGPGAPEYFEAFKKEFYATMQALLAE
ncbi:redoxin family protein [Phnomibacter ginsenosidimutans]|uniref:Redoxin family protein n=2 Tax=Phnomibacter ginsenosidimutans TaxID=2676868 RepID=A0A6I6GB08_9BACT|nr:redoxin family protein [Phnomibacter ginsenosidimutans]